MGSIKRIFNGILAAVLITILTGLAASAETTDSCNEVNLAGLTLVGNAWLDSIFLGRLGFGFYGKGYGIELGAITAPWYPGSGAFFDGSFVINPLSDKPISPVIRIGAMTSTVGGFLPFIGGGLRIRATRKFGFRAEYAYLVTSEMGIVTVGAFFNF